MWNLYLDASKEDDVKTEEVMYILLVLGDLPQTAL
jgi:hypothetical protein